MDERKRALLKPGSIWTHYNLPNCPVQVLHVHEDTRHLSFTFCNSRRVEGIDKFLEIFDYVAPDRVCAAIQEDGSVFHPQLRVAVEGMGGTVYITTADHDCKEKGKRGYIAEIGVGADYWAKTQKEALKIAYELVSLYNDARAKKEGE